MSDEPEVIFPLRGESLAGWLRTSGAKLFSEFSSTAQALDYLRGQGGAIRTQTFYDIAREVQGLTRFQSQLESARPDNLVPLGYTDYSHGLHLADSFLYKVSITGTDPATGESKSRFVSVYSNSQLTKGSVLSQAAALVMGLEEFYGIVPEKYELSQAMGRTELDEEAFFDEL
jgi:hypothetical protein